MARQTYAIGPMEPRVKTAEVKLKRKTLQKTGKAYDVVKDIKGLRKRTGVLKKGLKGTEKKSILGGKGMGRMAAQRVAQALRRRLGSAQ